MKNQFFIPNKGDRYDSDDSSLIEADEIGLLEEPSTPESVSDHHSSEADEENQNDSNYSLDDSEDDSDIDDFSSNSETDEVKLKEKFDHKNLEKENGMSEKGCHSNDSSATDKKISTEDAGCSKQQNDVNTFKGDSSCSDSDADSTDDTALGIQDFFGVKPNQEALKIHPPKYSAPNDILDICFHPKADLIASATIDGTIIICSYTVEAVKEISHLKYHKDSCRCVCYNEDGSLLYTISTDKSLAIIDTATSKPKMHIKNAHSSPLYSFLDIDENQCATGDDDGNIKLWDVRQPKEIFSFNCSEETVTSLLCDSELKYLTATVADGSLTAIDMKSHNMVQSELLESELTCQALLKNDTQLVVGTGQGDIVVFTWGSFNYPCSTFKGHTDMVTCLVPIADNLVITGCEDGIIRATDILSTEYLGIIGQHRGFGVESASLSHCGSYFASCSKENLSFWDIDYIYSWISKKAKLGKTQNKRKATENKISKVQKLGHMPSSRQRNNNDFFRDFPQTVDSDDKKGPVTGTGYESD